VRGIWGQFSVRDSVTSTIVKRSAESKKLLIIVFPLPVAIL